MLWAFFIGKVGWKCVFLFCRTQVGRGTGRLVLQIYDPLNQSSKFQQGEISKLPFMDQGELSGKEIKICDISDQSNKTHYSISHSERQAVEGSGAWEKCIFDL